MNPTHERDADGPGVCDNCHAFVMKLVEQPDMRWFCLACDEEMHEMPREEC